MNLIYHKSESPRSDAPEAALQARLDALPGDDNWGVEAARMLLEAADDLGSSDLHLTCQRDCLLARARRDDALVPLARVPAERRELLLARFKVLARLPAFVRHEPQDGRIEWRRRSGDAPRLLRAAFLPTIHGESLVVRFPEVSNRLLELEALGMSESMLAGLRRVLMAPEGTILITGPSGCGKTTTLYALLDEMHRRRGDRLNFITIEDPVERDLGFAAQMQVNEAQGLTFDRALRASLRHDPNVLLIGEIRDVETARIAVQAGMTGHFVFSTLHAGRVSRVFTRLLSMGLEPYLVASALSGAVAQRLVRTLCTACRRAAADDSFASEGCEACSFTGYQGRTGIFEFAHVTEPLRELILARATPSQIADEVARVQTGDLAAEALRLVAEGRISRAEMELTLVNEEPAP